MGRIDFSKDNMLFVGFKKSFELCIQKINGAKLFIALRDLAAVSAAGLPEAH